MPNEPHQRPDNAHTSEPPAASARMSFADALFAAAAGQWSDNEQSSVMAMLRAWMKMIEDELREKQRTILDIFARLNVHDEEINRRVKSSEYQSLLRKAFRNWSGAESTKKQEYIRNILCNAAATRIVSDDVVSLFIEWLQSYSEFHFAVIGELYHHPGSTRGEIWDNLGRGEVREDSADADLFKLLVRDLSTGGIIRQHRETVAILVAHNDKKFLHVHGMLNAVHPETGLVLDEGFERRRAQAWALEYEREHGRIYCEQRLLDPSEREDAPTRSAWLAFQENEKSFERAEKSMRENARISDTDENKSNIANFSEWKILKEIQKRERMDYFAEGKSEFRELRKSIYREVREEFRDRWADFYAAKKDGSDIESLAEIKAELIADQKAVLEARRDEACKELRASRDDNYRELLADQRETRTGMRWRQEAGLDNALFLELVEERSASKELAPAIRDAAEATTARRDDDRSEAALTPTNSHKHERSGVKSGADVGANIGVGIGFSIISLLESLVDGFVGSKPDPKPRQAEPESRDPDPFEAVIADARKRQQREQEDADDEWRKRQRSLGE
jgi:hypothetical protein